jgi:hypothetical protein
MINHSVLSSLQDHIRIGTRDLDHLVSCRCKKHQQLARQEGGFAAYFSSRHSDGSFTESFFRFQRQPPDRHRPCSRQHHPFRQPGLHHRSLWPPKFLSPGVRLKRRIHRNGAQRVTIFTHHPRGVLRRGWCRLMHRREL